MDNFNTEFAIKSLLDLVGQTNIYLDKTIFGSQKKNISFLLLLNVIRFIENIFSCFGVHLAQSQHIGVDGGGHQGGGQGRGKEKELLDLLVEFRNDIKINLKAKDNANMWKIVDQIRDEKLPKLGWTLKVSYPPP